ncbi:single-stranded-DNA-specific exonuclease RecJ [Maridesulfovibrio hydrothermalis]|uniref:Single-stranded-DNA-specific exonuclease RecJ n=1 Tax=Maridesulfovibrio hydrothermalis AM13 = DSM 14728 TaxID=1121451 RepID=L0RCK2_9BACT|nr:single-stranded-DNA-specific exonuclease RecJ [Maridesulfovibrio hydrothermalis]CCO23910.1 Single-stranded-DNA-specific exonuclease RecJ [Maridesulfovibrio hydrothermalis AM13 = DSM 14728]
MPKIWKLRSEEELPSSISEIASELGITELLAEILWNRGFQSRKEMDLFLSPGLRNLCKPVEIPGLEESAAVLTDGIVQGKKFAVWGDYDVDGVTSTAVVKSVLKDRGFECTHHLPNRLEEGYGLNIENLQKLRDDGVELLLTVDCGITNNVEISAANEMGMTVIVSDHHLPGEVLPPAAAICNPRLTEYNGKKFEDCPCEALAGVGVAFMLMAQVNKLLPGDPVDMRAYLDFVALGTIADVVGLQGQNRILVKNGLLLLKEARRPGLAALKVVSGYDMFAAIGAGQVGFGLAPRINASGRMGDPDKALELLMTEEMETARPIAKVLDTLNSERRAEEDRILEQALKQAEEQVKRHNRAGLVLFSPDWHPGIIGIVASRVVEKFYRPTIMLCEEEGIIKGSARSIKEFHLHEALTGMSDLFLNFGGHKLAAGMSLKAADFEDFRERFDKSVLDIVGSEPLKPTLKVDKELPLENIDYILLKELDLMQPFGMGNPEPVFTTPPVEVMERRPMGKDHVKLTLSDLDKTRKMPAKAWRMAEQLGSELIGAKMRFAFSPKIDKFNGIPTIELTIRDYTRKLS